MSIQTAIESKWNQIKGEVKQQWGKLTDDDLTAINGARDKLVGKIMDKYNLARREAEEKVDALWKKFT